MFAKLQVSILLAVLSGAAGLCFAADGEAPPAPTTPAAPEGGGGRPREGEGGRRGPGGPGSLGPMTSRGVGQPYTAEMFKQAVMRMAGLPSQGGVGGSKIDSLPLGEQFRFIIDTPVGGVENFQGTGKAMLMETVFKLTEEQTKSVADLRAEYQTAQTALEQEIAQQQKTLAEKAAELRLKFEQRANDILAGADKETKQKLDALALEVHAKSKATAAETLAQADPNDRGKILEFARDLREKNSKIVQEGQAKMLDLVPTESRAKLAEIFEKQKAQQENAYRWVGGQGGQGGPGGAGRRRGGDGQDAPKDGAKPDEAKPKEEKQF